MGPTLLLDKAVPITMKSQILILRLLVGYLGEKSQFAWWPTSVFGSTSTPFLLPCFPRTLQLAQYHAVVEAARRLHDEHIGIGRVLHLFRLPEEIEQDLHNTILVGTTDSIADITNKESAQAQLSKLADGKQINPSEGPFSLPDNTNNIQHSSTIQTMAATYLGAFNCNVKTYPYLVIKA